jgi:hypothetical protein
MNVGVDIASLSFVKELVLNKNSSFVQPEFLDYLSGESNYRGWTNMRKDTSGEVFRQIFEPLYM